MTPPVSSPHRLTLFSDGVFAVIITILVLELKPPHAHALSALAALWPTGLSYAVSYLFVAIVWINHHHLFNFAKVATTRLIWANIAHIFTVSLVPFATAWIGDSGLAPAPVAFYAGVFMAVNATYILLCNEAMDRTAGLEPSAAARRANHLMRLRAMITLGLFALAGLTALWSPILGMAVIVFCLALYIRPGLLSQAAPSARRARDAATALPQS